MYEIIEQEMIKDGVQALIGILDVVLICVALYGVFNWEWFLGGWGWFLLLGLSPSAHRGSF